ncbi:unnamed protein product, partial [Laminaria digitata]
MAGSPELSKPPVNRGFLGDDEADALPGGRGQSGTARGASKAFLGGDEGAVGDVSLSRVPLNLEDSYLEDDDEDEDEDKEEDWEEFEDAGVEAVSRGAQDFSGASPRVARVFDVPGGIAVSNSRSG